MQELITKVSQSAGITEEQAKKSIEEVAAYLKSKLPAAFHSQIDNLIGGGKLSEGIKEKLMETAVDVKEKTEDIIKDVTEKTEEAIKVFKDKLDEIFSKKKE